MTPTENEQAGVSGTTQESGTVPTPTFSEQPASSPSLLSPEVVSALSEQLKPIIEEAAERAVQGTKDKRFAGVEKREQFVKDVLTEMKKQGVAIPPEYQSKLEMQEYIDQKLQSAATVRSTGTTLTSEQFNVVEELNKLGLNTNDQDVVKLVTDKYRNPDHFRAEATALALRKAKSPPPSDSTSPPASGTPMPGAMSDEKREEISGQLVDLMREPTKNASKIDALRKQLKGA